MRTVLYAKNSSAALLSDSFAYDAALRLQSVSDGVNSAGYSYLANSALVSRITFAQSGTAKMTAAHKSYDYLNRLTAIQFEHEFGDGGQRRVRLQCHQPTDLVGER